MRLTGTASQKKMFGSATKKCLWKIALIVSPSERYRRKKKSCTLSITQVLFFYHCLKTVCSSLVIGIIFCCDSYFIGDCTAGWRISKIRENYFTLSCRWARYITQGFFTCLYSSTTSWCDFMWKFDDICMGRIPWKYNWITCSCFEITKIWGKHRDADIRIILFHGDMSDLECNSRRRCVAWCAERLRTESANTSLIPENRYDARYHDDKEERFGTSFEHIMH